MATLITINFGRLRCHAQSAWILLSRDFFSLELGPILDITRSITRKSVGMSSKAASTSITERKPDLQHKTRMSSMPPSYEASKSPPAYGSACASVTAKTSQSQSKPKQTHVGQTQDHTGSCGMPASMVMSVLGSSSASGGSSGSSRSKDIPQKVTAGDSWHLRGVSSHWNVQGVPLRSFGTFRRSRK